uniref:Putative secreted protein n=1 Tax=Amblyomma triste TaxID=251400 RepID=A0A023G5J6_AMBTT
MGPVVCRGWSWLLGTAVFSHVRWHRCPKMQRKTFLLSILIITFGLCAAEGETDQERIKKSEDLYRKALNVVQTTSNLRLFKISSSINKTVAACLVTKFLEKETRGAIRMLYRKDTPSQKTKIYVALHYSTVLPIRPSLQAHPIRGQLPPYWNENLIIKHAEIDDCIILESTDLNGDLSCLLWALQKNNKCMKIFDKMCTGEALVANMKTCQWTKQKKARKADN